MVDHREELLPLPPCGVMDRDPTGETLSALCPPQEAGFTLNKPAKLGAAKIGQAKASVKAQSPPTPAFSDE